jgi:hypothetical protein
MGEARGVRWWQFLAVVLALGLGGGYVWLKQSQAATDAALREAATVPSRELATPMPADMFMGGSKSGTVGFEPSDLIPEPKPAAAEPGSGEAPKGFVAPAIDEAQPGEEGEP